MTEVVTFRNALSGIGRQLGQLAPANTTAASIYSPADGIIANVTAIFVANVTGSAATATLYHDDDGTTYNNGTMISVFSVGANNFAYYPFGDGAGLWLANPDGNLAVKTGTADALTFTVYGREILQRTR